MAPMATLSSVLRVLSDFGDAAGWLIAALVLFAYGRRIIQENEKAHAAITENVKENRRQVAGRSVGWLHARRCQPAFPAGL